MREKAQEILEAFRERCVRRGMEPAEAWLCEALAREEYGVRAHVLEVVGLMHAITREHTSEEEARKKLEELREEEKKGGRKKERTRREAEAAELWLKILAGWRASLAELKKKEEGEG